MAEGTDGTWAKKPVLFNSDADGSPWLRGDAGQHTGEHVWVSLWMVTDNLPDEQLGTTVEGNGSATVVAKVYANALHYTYVETDASECYSENWNWP